MVDDSLCFGTFELRPKQAVLLDGGRRIPLGSRALAILTVLARRAGGLVTTDELIQFAWPGVIVEESNVRVQVAALRKALRDGMHGQRYIVNESGRGYRFIAPIVSAALSGLEPRSEVIRWHQRAPSLPLIGRDKAIADVVERLGRERMLTLVGPGGIGKTSVAMSCMARLADLGRKEICFVDLSTLDDPSRVAAAIASALHLPLSGEPIPVILRALRGQSALIVLDSCEHVIVAAATLAETLLLSCSGIGIMATSREALRCKGEAVYRLPPLQVPPNEDAPSATDITAFSAVQLFAERAATSLNPVSITPMNAGTVARICRQLDGLPLALELAAACAGTLGLDILASGLGDRLNLLTQGRRTIARHETLRAMLDWSHDLLADDHRAVLESLSVFRTAFTLNGAIAVAQMDGVSETDVVAAVLQLAATSLLHVDKADTTAIYRLLDTTRVYATEKLVASGRLDQARRQHADYVRMRLAAAEAEWKAARQDDWWARNGSLVEDVQAALDWAFSPEGDARTGIELTISSAPLWLGRSQLGEYWTRVTQSLNRLIATDLGGGREEMQLQLALGHLVFHIHGPGPAEVLAFQRALEIAESTDDVPSMTTAVWALAHERGVMGDHPAAMSLCNKLIALGESEGNLETAAIASRTLALTKFRQGNLVEAQRIGEALVAEHRPVGPSFGTVYRYDQTTASRANLACVLWIRGHADRALEMVRGAVADAAEARNPSSLCYILSSCACPLAFWSGDNELAAHYIDLLASETQRNAFAYMQGWADRYRRIWTARKAGVDVAGSNIIPGVSNLIWFDRQILVSIEAGLLSGPDLVDTGARQASWCGAEVLRAEGERALRSSETDRQVLAERLFVEALDVAREQGALAWELRAAISLASSKRKGKQPHAAFGILQPVLERFSEGFETTDLLAASVLLNELRNSA
ncbi:ATP-binding protein [Lichenifustis flavocetrariae]|uniref:Helix-turn-helix transcriptional regulator n=1 Tax=Lichenifustis flavocetrariae TaxID=2949735 RepID=A0AA42CQW4_9HYPH|nr:winged helix-turn-helix domain-containing protein [Lichenifustis flavocetrariae]MCW6511852.1 helix-turn-helix transcriptional regulator [Lichenifustis flavocetrariae]